MAVTKDQALTEHEFHEEHEKSGCASGKTWTWRRNGQTRTWKRSPVRFRVPVKYGLYMYGAITETNAIYYHAASVCPLRAAQELLTDGRTPDEAYRDEKAGEGEY